MRFCSDQLFQIGEKLVFDLAVQDIDLSEIPAEVVHSTEAEDGGTFCTGVKFCFDSGRMHKPEITHDLLRIESQLRVSTEFPT